MASTYTPRNALDRAKAHNFNRPITSIEHLTADDAKNVLWQFPLRWTRKVLSDITVVDSTSEYTTIPSDFYRLLEFWQVRTDTTPNEVKTDIEIVEWLNPSPSFERFWADRVAFIQELNTQAGGFRVYPQPEIVTGTTSVYRGVYQFNPAKITAANISDEGLLLLPDQYFPVYSEWVLYYIFKYTNDSRTGNVVVDTLGRAQYTGQLGVAMDFLKNMLRSEDYPATSLRSPEVGSNLGAYRNF